MDKLKILLDKAIGTALIGCTLSGRKNKLGGANKVKIRRVIIKGRHMFQITEYAGAKAIHRNEDGETTKAYITDKLLTEFKQCQLQCEAFNATVLSGSKGNLTIREKAAAYVTEAPALEHNRVKEYLLPEGTPVPFLIDLGVMSHDGHIAKAKYDKFRQINRFLEFIRDVLPHLERDRQLTIIDFGCGKSYLTFAIYYYLKVLNGLDISIIGMDLKREVIERCNVLAEKYGYEGLRFIHGDIADYEGISQADMVVTLHACDTATDYALAKAVQWNAAVILSVPCCQHEFNRTIANDTLAPAFSYGIIKERTAALLTDASRACLLDLYGYDTQILEFIDMEHTPKNLLIRGVKRKKGAPSHTAAEYDAMVKALNVSPMLYKLLSEGGSKNT